MIKFFRRIRKRLLTENKFSKYLIYAIGEIALVMIGILLALQVNNWNENRKDSIYKEQLVNNLILELHKAKSELTSSIQHAEKSVKSGDLFLKIDMTNAQTIPVDSIKELVLLSTSKILFKLTLSAYDGSKSSGRLSLLDNQDVLNGYSEIFVGLEDYHHHFPIAGRVFYTGPVWDFRKKYGSFSVLTEKSEKVPLAFRMNDEEYRRLILEPLTYAVVENANTLNWNILVSLRNMDKSINKLIELLEKIR